MKDHEIAELVNKLRDVAIEFHGAQQLRSRIQDLVLPTLAASAPKVQMTDAEIEAIRHGAALLELEGYEQQAADLNAICVALGYQGENS